MTVCTWLHQYCKRLKDQLCCSFKRNKMESITVKALLRLAIFAIFIQRTGGVSLAKFDDEIISYLEGNSYQSTALGVMVDGKLIYTKGFTVGSPSTLQGNPMKVWPIGRLSETITALAVLKLIQNGEMRLNSTVFGDKGILKTTKPFKRHGKVDNRLYDITVEDLLRHTSGWDSKAGPLFDPALNEQYLKRGIHVPDIRKEIGALKRLTTYHIIRYMINKPLQYQPGTKSIHSTFHYSILAEIVEEISGQDYRKYVKKYVFDLCGMWSTRLGPEHHLAHTADLDATAGSLGWYSNVFDLLRMIKCIDGSGRYRLLSDKTVRQIIQRNEEKTGTESWHGLGFMTNKHHAIWQVTSGSKHNAVLFHNSLIPVGNSTHNKPIKPLSFVFLFDSKVSLNAINKHKLNALVRSVSEWPTSNLFTSDLSDIPALSDSTIFKLSVPERRMKAFANALKMEYHEMSWVSAAHDHKGTHFSVIAKYAPKGKNFIFECGLTQRTLYDHRKLLRAYDYDLQFIQSYVSWSHNSKYRYMTISTKVTKMMDTILGTKKTDEQYKKLFVANRGRGYVPKIQSVTYIHGNATNDFIFVKKHTDNYKAYINMHLKDLENIIKLNTDAKRVIQYMDVTDVNGLPVFSAIFAESPNISGGFFRKDVSGKDVLVTIENNKRNGMVPFIVIGYTVKNSHIKYAAYLVKYKPQ